MKKTFVLFFVLIAIFLFTYCGPSKKAIVAAPPPVVKLKLSYDAKIAPILMANCSPCHFPANGGEKTPLDSYASASDLVDNILRRIQMNPTDRGFMPLRKPKMADSSIAAIKQWKDDGLMK
jgi:hypothetical protein